MLIMITAPINNRDYYLGIRLNIHDNWIALATIDANVTYTNIHLYRKDTYIIENDLTEKDFYEFQEKKHNLLNPFDFKKKIQEFKNLKWNNLEELLFQIKEINPIISLTSQENMTYTGKIQKLNSSNIYLQEIDENHELTEFPLVIPYDEIIALSVNSIEHTILNKWLTTKRKTENRTLVEIHLDYKDDARFESFYIGQIIKQNSDYLLLAGLNDLGQLDGVYLISKKHITHITSESCELDYYQFAMNYHLQNHSFNLRNLKTDFDLTTFKDWLKPNTLAAFDNSSFDNTNIGIVKGIQDNTLLFQNVVDYKISAVAQEISIQDLASVELTSNEQILLKSYLNR
ncbi:hypothetical protein [Lactobacillus hominis]|uniref:Uncharacterized protein n=1 Tax=Lactobacillus hominis DSM 23910 = CRBIP 24.179 TaxID=1423758 RepID=I7L6R2_9LACO|nr:hypothetical protein [Lactobacillus hominis]MCT3347825.1 hypothetical protein [Lactobacillus hominis]CCI82172.1 Putative uncharacterized protein [Lactobacillus hominis DSM 23910 = CRBIP 24.179]